VRGGVDVENTNAPQWRGESPQFGNCALAGAFDIRLDRPRLKIDNLHGVVRVLSVDAA
jgi:hypothetical protein